MAHSQDNRFQDFFEDQKYVVLKNYLYNYLLRKRAVEAVLQKEEQGLALEVGSGLSPVMTQSQRMVYSDISLTALQTLKGMGTKGWFVVADGSRLPFKSGIFTQTISSEVLEHLEDDRGALRELTRVMMSRGSLVLTFPHRRFYFANDDRFVGHFRRYELSEMNDLLKEVGLRSVLTQKVLGPLEKLTMSFVVFCFSLIQKFNAGKKSSGQASKLINVFGLFFKWANRFYAVLVWFDALIFPQFLSTVLLVKAKKASQNTMP